MSFKDLGLSDALLSAAAAAGYSEPTPIQRDAIPYVLMGRDVLGRAQTGTGKTAAFALPMIDILAGGRSRARMPRALVLEPTRELAQQVAETFDTFGKNQKVSSALIIGGASMGPQEQALERGVDVLIATPGRLIDLFERGKIILTAANILVIDETDRMLDMGFIPDVEKIVGFLTARRQTLFFSATFPDEIRRLAEKFLSNPKEIVIQPRYLTADTIEDKITLVADRDKREALRQLIRGEDIANAIVFCNRKRDADVLFRSLKKHGFNVGVLHGDLAQETREKTLLAFRNNEITILVASDVAARGLDISGISHVFNFDVPFNAEDYVHRIGRTGRAGRAGRAFTLATREDGRLIEAIERLIKRQIPRLEMGGFEPSSGDDGEARRDGRGGRGRRGGHGRDRGRRRDHGGHSRHGGADQQSPIPAETMPPDAPAPDARHETPAQPSAPEPQPPQAQGQPDRQHHGQPRHDRPKRHGDRGPHHAHPARENRPPGHDDQGRRDHGQRNQSQRDHSQRDQEPRIQGLGDHTPAFLLRSTSRPRGED
jgi:superfamily II DNA/RNA helicase